MLNPALLFKVKLLILPVNVEAGMLCADEPLNTIVAEALLASILPAVWLMLPFRVKVFAPKDSVPEARLSELGKTKERPRVTPLILLIVKDVLLPIVKVPPPLIVWFVEPFSVMCIRDRLNYLNRLKSNLFPNYHRFSRIMKAIHLQERK